jgi:hypothetical protein
VELPNSTSVVAYYPTKRSLERRLRLAERWSIFLPYFGFLYNEANILICFSKYKNKIVYFIQNKISN